MTVPGARLRIVPHAWRLSGWAAALVLAGTTLEKRGSEHDCVRDRDAQDWKAAIVSCSAELDRTNNPARAVDAAKAAYYLQRPYEAIQFATRALQRPTAADAHYLIGSALLALGDYDPAAIHLEAAFRLHAAAGNAYAEARDQHQLSGVRYQLGDYQAALAAEAAARDAALRSNDQRMPVFVDIARSDILRQIGDLRGAEAAIERAILEAREPSDKVVALLKRGELHIDQGHSALARDPLSRALAIERVATVPRPPILQALHTNLSYVERKAGAFSRALDEMTQARRFGTDNMSYHLNRGLVYADMGRWAEASADLAAAEAEPLTGEWSWWVPFQRAQVVARLGDLATAVAEDRRAMAQVARLASSAGALGPTVVAQHRGPHLHLIGVLAKQRRWSDVLDVVAMMDSQLLLESHELAVDLAPTTPGVAPHLLQSAAPAPDPAATRLALEAWRGRRLEILVPGGDRMWRLDILDGELVVDDVGSAGGLGELARALERNLDDVAAGRALGQAMLPASLAPQARVELLVVGPLARAPLAGLRVGAMRAIARYQLVRVPGLLPRTARAHARGPAIAIGDPTGDLPAAAGEARRVAARLDGRALIGAQATRAAFLAAGATELLHVAAHTTHRNDGVAIELVDGPVSVDRIARLEAAPRVVVLASCGASVGRDDADNGSLTNAFLDAGAELVVATRWSIDDGEAAQFVEMFYAANGASDPISALAEVQRTSPLSTRTWAAFETFVARPAR